MYGDPIHLSRGSGLVFLPLTASVTLSLEREPVVQEPADVPRSDAPESQQADEPDRAEQTDDEPPGQ